MTLATRKDKEFALAELSRRKTENTPKVLDNRNLPLGYPMYYYCEYCSAQTDMLPENHRWIPKEICDECQALIDKGWL